MKDYDFIFAGGGLAGLSLALHLSHSPLRDRSMLVVDRDAKQRNDRTWCFWSDGPTLFDDVVCREWERLEVVSDAFRARSALRAYRYKMIRSTDLYRCARARLAALPNVRFLQGSVEEIHDGADAATVTVRGERCRGRWVFDSRFQSSRFHPDPARCHYLRQYCKGWLVESVQPAFDPTCATFMDFRTPQQGELRFFYVLPLAERRALVEFVTFSPDHFDEILDRYVRTILGIDQYRVLESEGGVNPATDAPFARQASAHVMNIGIRGGRLKPTSGYAFTRIQSDSSEIVHSLLRSGQPFDVPADPALFRLCDTLLLDIMQRHGESVKPIFTALFRHNPLDRVLRFLDQQTSPAENAALIASLPPLPFLRALAGTSAGSLKRLLAGTGRRGSALAARR